MLRAPLRDNVITEVIVIAHLSSKGGNYDLARAIGHWLQLVRQWCQLEHHALSIEHIIIIRQPLLVLVSLITVLQHGALVCCRPDRER